MWIKPISTFPYRIYFLIINVIHLVIPNKNYEVSNDERPMNKTSCKMNECSRGLLARQLCNLHYKQRISDKLKWAKEIIGMYKEIKHE